MRSDVIWYIVAAFYFVLAIASSFIFTELNSIFWISLTTIIGIFFIIAGYSQRPKAKKPIKTLPPITPEESTDNTEESITQQTPKEEETIKNSSIAETMQIENPQTETEEPTEETKTLPEEPTLPPQEPEPTTTITTQNNNDNKDETTSTTQIKPDTEKTVETETEEIPLTNVEGIGEKRAAKLNELGIHTIKELSQTPIDDLTKGLNIPTKTATKLIEAAKQQLQ